MIEVYRRYTAVFCIFLRLVPSCTCPWAMEYNIIAAIRELMKLAENAGSIPYRVIISKSIKSISQHVPDNIMNLPTSLYILVRDFFTVISFISVHVLVRARRRPWFG